MRLSPARSGAVGEANTVPKLTGLMFWKRVEAFAIAVVFCMMMGMSIHHLLAFPGGTSPPSGILEPRDASRLARSTPQVSASSQQPAATRESRQSHDHDEEEANVFGEDLVIQYQAPTASSPGPAEKPLPLKNTTSKSGVRNAIGHDAEMLANTVVQYGDDVTMWSLAPSKKSALNHTRR
jgi:hypothetical protein